jgi:predicted nuclease with TOPRIM domain
MTSKQLSEKFDQFSVEIESRIESVTDDTHEIYEAIENAHEKLSQENEAILEKIDKIEDDIRDLREKLGEILTILYSR